MSKQIVPVHAHPEDTSDCALGRITAVAKLLQIAGETNASEIIVQRDLFHLGMLLDELAEQARAAFEGNTDRWQSLLKAKPAA